ncbi:MAG: hypothetical protein DLM59_05490 [Pseudonocardiales bacterium]|nr:MAG: hypothetical protein DLM59_05490 [Pseudonocardiales bacterium]
MVYGGLLYLLHATTAFSAVLPLTRRVEPVLLARPGAAARRAVVSGPLMFTVLLVPGRSGSLPVAVAGALSALGVGVLLVVLLRRPAR